MACAHRESNRPATTIKTLPDDTLRDIFAFCLLDLYSSKHMEVWQSLVHVCFRWRQIIFASPRYLDLQLHCSKQRPFRKDFCLWPEFPLTVRHRIPEHKDDLIAVLEHPDRVCRAELIITSSKVEEVVAVMQVSFPMLKQLGLSFLRSGRDVLALPDGFLGGSAPCLQNLRLHAIVFPELPTLLLTARGLVSLDLTDMPPTGYGYIAPEAMVGGLTALTRLRTLCITFPFPIPAHRQRRRRPHPTMLAVLPALTKLEFEGDSEYLEDLVAQIDAPRVDDVRIEYCVEEIQTRQLSQFIGRSVNLAKFGRAELTIDYHETCIELSPPQVPCMIHVLDQLAPMLSNVGHLSVLGYHLQSRLRYKRSSLRHYVSWDWLPLLHPFLAVEALYVSGGIEGYIGCALDDIDEEMVTEELPALRLLWLKDDSRIYDYREKLGSIKRFLSLRRLSGHPVTVVKTQDEFDEFGRR